MLPFIAVLGGFCGVKASLKSKLCCMSLYHMYLLKSGLLNIIFSSGVPSISDVLILVLICFLIDIERDAN